MSDITILESDSIFVCKSLTGKDFKAKFFSSRDREINPYTFRLSNVYEGFVEEIARRTKEDIEKIRGKERDWMLNYVLKGIEFLECRDVIIKFLNEYFEAHKEYVDYEITIE